MYGGLIATKKPYKNGCKLQNFAKYCYKYFTNILEISYLTDYSGL